MITKLTIRNFKRFGEVEVDLGDIVVFIGPNNSGKTSALQALTLWELGLKKWTEKRQGKTTPEKRPGVTINRRDLVAVPVPYANLLWRNLHVRDVSRTDGRQVTQNIRIDIIAEGVTNDRAWECGLEFDYANDESFYCRPLRLSEDRNPSRMVIPDEVSNIRVAFLPPMSGLAANETRLDQGAINVRVGEGRTAEVLRNLCYGIHENSEDDWQKLVRKIKILFGAKIDPPQYIVERGEITMAYHERDLGLDLSSSGRGLQQTLLVLAYMYANPGAVLLLDEPDAHLEILRQRQIYQLLTDTARDHGNQIIAASHSEVMLNEAAERDVVVSFVGNPHRIDDRGTQVAKALKEINFEDYYLAEETKWVLYLEGATDLAILQAFAQRIGHRDAEKSLERPFVKYVGDQPKDVLKHFYGLQEGVPNLKGIAIFDRLKQPLPNELEGMGYTWRRREIENYLCYRETLEAYAKGSAIQDDSFGPLFASTEADRRIEAMHSSIEEITNALEALDNPSPWDSDTKVSDDFLTPVFKKFFKKLGLQNLMAKKNFHALVEYVPLEKIDPEIEEKLDAIAKVAQEANDE
ncbi:MAG: AAA family ATPase [Thermodesulfobacteriota bacterium]|nr:AAA family ATPase [Thermodesulfobacteriota bacterium]